jgi:hypothetical protein
MNALALAALTLSIVACGSSSSSHGKAGTLTESTPVSSATFRNFLVTRIQVTRHISRHAAEAFADCGIRLFLQQRITTFQTFEAPLLQSQIAADGKQCAHGGKPGRGPTL